MNPFEILGWVCTALVLTGFIVNSRGHLQSALSIWLVSDICWIVYDIYIDNPQHIALAVGILIINVTGLIRLQRQKKTKHENTDLG